MIGLLKSGLNAKNKITAIGTLAAPVLRYSFGSIIWRLEEIRKIDMKLEGFLRCIQCITQDLIQIGYI